MTMKKRLFLAVSMLLVLSGCASMSNPDAASLSQLPLVEFGQPVPTGGNYVLHFAQGKPIEMPVSFEGDLFQEPSRETLRVKLKRDIYVHKGWLSYDMQNWVDAKSALDLQVQVVIPGYNHPKPGYIRLEMNAAE
jgi:hypothetical protein